MRCPSCGNENREGARFCDFCGTELRSGVEAPEVPGQADVLPSDVPSEVGAGRYRPRRFLGQGGRKRVYLADDAVANMNATSPVTTASTAGGAPL